MKIEEIIARAIDDTECSQPQFIGGGEAYLMNADECAKAALSALKEAGFVVVPVEPIKKEEDDG